MDHKRKSQQPQPQQQPIEPEMEKRPRDDEHARDPATEPPKDKPVDDL
jgi:hypothetical protein